MKSVDKLGSYNTDRPRQRPKSTQKGAVPKEDNPARLWWQYIINKVISNESSDVKKFKGNHTFMNFSTKGGDDYKKSYLLQQMFK